MPNIASGKVVQVTGINLKATGTTDILPAQTGLKVIVLKCLMTTATFTGAGAGPTVSLGANASTYDNVLFDKTLNANAGEVQPINPTANATNYQQVADIGSTALKFNVKTAAGAGISAMTGDLYLEYVLTPF